MLRIMPGPIFDAFVMHQAQPYLGVHTQEMLHASNGVLHPSLYPRDTFALVADLMQHDLRFSMDGNPWRWRVGVVWPERQAPLWAVHSSWEMATCISAMMGVEYLRFHAREPDLSPRWARSEYFAGLLQFVEGGE